MKTKQKNTSRGIFIQRAKKSFKYQTPLVLLFVALFVFTDANAKVVVNELMVGEKDATNNEFVELYNDSSNPVVLDGYKLKIKKTVTGAENYLVNTSVFKGIIRPHGYFTIAYPDYQDKIKADLSYSSKSNPLSNNNTVLLCDNNGILLDQVGFGSAPLSETAPAQNPAEGQSTGRLNGKDSDDNSKDFTKQNPTPTKENEIYVEPPIEKKTYPKGLFINELFPKPLKDSKDVEFVELFNSTDETIKLDDWQIIDRGSNKCDLSGGEIDKNSFLVLENDTLKKCSITLNDTGVEIVNLVNPNGEVISSATYASAKQSLSYSFNGDSWHWTKFSTPGAGNKFEDAPDSELSLPDEVFVNVYAYFSVGGLADESKVAWDFGDGHKSYLIKTKHKYEKTGKYEASVKYAAGSEDVIKNFTVEVVKMSHPKVRITQINANPAEVDTGIESLTIENKTKKKINLNGWSIATGWKKKFIKHPIREDVIIKGGKQKELTHDESSFTLNNTKAQIQLRYPDGKVADEVKYKKENGTIADGEIYVKEKGKGWEWKGSEQDASDKIPASSAGEQDAGNLPAGGLDTIVNDRNNSDADKIEVEIPTTEVEIKPNEKKVSVLLEQNSVGKLGQLDVSPHVLGISTVREVDEQYRFTQQVPEREHYAVSFFKNIFSNLNGKINLLLNYFLK